MKATLILFFIFPLFILKSQSQSIGPVKAYLNDTTGFTKFPEVYLLGQLSRRDEYKTLELDTWVSPYNPKKPNTIEYRNLYRYPESHHRNPDTNVLFKRAPLKTFLVVSPAATTWYLAAKTKTNQIISIGNTTELKAFLGKITNEYDAYLWLYSHDSWLDIPDKTNPYFKYKRVNGGFLIGYNGSYGPWVHADPAHVLYSELIFFVGTDLRIILLSSKDNINKTGIRYIQ